MPSRKLAQKTSNQITTQSGIFGTIGIMDSKHKRKVPKVNCFTATFAIVAASSSTFNIQNST